MRTDRAFADECLARHLLRKPRDERIAWLADFEKRHGQAAAAQLKDVILVEHEKAKKARAPA